MDLTEGVLPIHNDIHVVQIHTRMHVYYPILRRGVIHHHGSILIVSINCFREVRDGAQQIRVVPAIREVVVDIAYILGHLCLRRMDGDRCGGKDYGRYRVPEGDTRHVLLHLHITDLFVVPAVGTQETRTVLGTRFEKLYTTLSLYFNSPVSETHS